MDRLPGFRDFYPEPLPQPDLWSADARQFIFDKWRAVAKSYGFRGYDGPPLEALELFTTKSGAEIVGQLYNFADKGQREISLRPEMTPTLARMVSAHERGYKKPIKWFSIPQLFRYERQQKGRMREHFQFNADIIGETAPAADAELIALLIDALRGFGLSSEDFVIRLSSRDAWRDFFVQHQGCPEDEFEFYQVIDKLDREKVGESEEKLNRLGFPLADIHAFIQAGVPTQTLQLVLDNLSARGLLDYVKIDYSVIRGLAYYTGIVFEAFDRKGELRAIAGGGRYDNLVKLISGGKVDLPALGFGMGDVVLLELLKERKLLPAFDSGLDAFILLEDERFRPDALRLIQSLREKGFAVEYSLTTSKSDKQFKRAQELKAAHVVKLASEPSGALEVRIRPSATREDVLVPLGDVVSWFNNSATSK
jgi:histidyl-tRNA synthetase